MCDDIKVDDWWGEDKEFPVDEWQDEVANGDTRMGYWAWVQHVKGEVE